MCFVEFWTYYDVDAAFRHFFSDRHYFTQRFFPLSFGIYVGVGFDGVDDGFGIGVGDGGAFDDVIEGSAEIVGPNFVETMGSSVAIE